MYGHITPHVGSPNHYHRLWYGRNIYNKIPLPSPMNQIHLWGEDKLIQLYAEDPLSFWINSFGGCRSNFIRGSLESKFKVKNIAWDYKLCHYIRPLNVKTHMGIFCYVEDVGIALTSQLNRGMTFNYDKLLPTPQDFSIDNWLDKIEEQIDNWCKPSPYFPITIINTDKIKDNKNIIENTLQVRLLNFHKRKTTSYHKDLLPYKDKIDLINKKLKKLPDFKYFNND